MKNNKLKVLGVILIDIGFIIYLGIFLYQTAIVTPDFKEIVVMVLRTLFVAYVNIDTFTIKNNNISKK